jgi:hypothetical protein
MATVVSFLETNLFFETIILSKQNLCGSGYYPLHKRRGADRVYL